MKKENKLPEGISEGMIHEAKSKGLQVKLAEIPTDDEGGSKTILVCVPTRAIVAQFRKFMDIDPKKADEILVKNCVLSHKEEILSNDELFNSTLATISDLIVVRKGTIKNL